MDWNVIQQYLPLYQKAAVLTVRLGVAGIFFAILIGLVCAVIQYEKVPVLRQLVSIYIQLSRNTPLLVQLFFLYYGLPKVGIKTNAAVCGIAGLAFLGGSYMAEAFRSGLESIEPIQTESAYSLGMSKAQTMRYIILPQAYVGADAHLGVGCIVNAGAIVDHNAQLGRGVHVAPGGIVKAGAEVAEFAKVDSGEIIRSPWESK